MKIALQNATGKNKLTIAIAINKFNVIYFVIFNVNNRLFIFRVTATQVLHLDISIANIGKTENKYKMKKE